MILRKCFIKDKKQKLQGNSMNLFPAVLQDSLLKKVLLYRSRFFLLIRDHFFYAGEGYGADNMFNPAGIFFRGVRGNIQDVGQENGQRFMSV